MLFESISSPKGISELNTRGLALYFFSLSVKGPIFRNLQALTFYGSILLIKFFRKSDDVSQVVEDKNHYR